MLHNALITDVQIVEMVTTGQNFMKMLNATKRKMGCLLYTSDAADE